jgi:hypothetical protein
MQLVRLFLEDVNRNDIEVDVFFNENKIREVPVYILVNRGTLSPSNLAVPSGTFTNIGNFVDTIQVNTGDNLNPHETLKGTSLLDLQLQIKLYAHNRAEIEDVSYSIYKLLLSVSDDIMGRMFSNIHRVMEPVLSPFMPVKDYDDMYSSEIDWSIFYIENNILLFKEKMLKYNNFIVQDKEAQDEINFTKDSE